MSVGESRDLLSRQFRLSIEDEEAEYGNGINWMTWGDSIQSRCFGEEVVPGLLPKKRPAAPIRAEGASQP
jgi:hypothetical protein